MVNIKRLKGRKINNQVLIYSKRILSVIVCISYKFTSIYIGVKVKQFSISLQMGGSIIFRIA